MCGKTFYFGRKVELYKARKAERINPSSIKDTEFISERLIAIVANLIRRLVNRVGGLFL
jgi:hypothetical protein